MAEQWLTVLKGIRRTRRTLAAGQALFRAGDAANALFHVERGCVVLSRHGAPLHRAEAGSLLAEDSLFSEIHGCDAIAQQDSVVAALPKSAVLLHLKVHADLTLAFTAYLARQVQALRGQLELVRMKSARDRVLAYLAQAGDSGGHITLSRPLTEMAAEIGMTREALYRTLTKLQAEGTVQRLGTRSFRLSPQSPSGV